MHNSQRADCEYEYEYSNIKTFEGPELPFDIGSLEKNVFYRLGEWTLQDIGINGYRLAYRIGIKCIPDKEGNPTLIYAIFGAAVSSKYKVTARVAQESEHKLEKVMEAYVERNPVNPQWKVYCVIIDTPHYMVEELKKTYRL